jgi:ADP-ribose pyrophosphatase
MPQNSAGDELVFSTKWFEILSRPSPGPGGPHFVISSSDFVTVVALNPAGRLLLVRQFRPAVARVTLEVPSGHVETGETPEEAARKELLEETGHVADKFELLLTVSPAVGRFTNRMWCYFTAEARPTPDPGFVPEAGVELVLHPGTIRSLVSEADFYSSLSHTALFAAVAKGRLNLDGPHNP